MHEFVPSIERDALAVDSGQRVASACILTRRSGSCTHWYATCARTYLPSSLVSSWADGNTDINPSNIMMTVADESLLERVETAEAENALPKKVVDNLRTIYSSHKLGLPKDGLWGQPALCDFGEARIGISHTGLIQPDLYRAPEVLFGMEWGPSVDIWSVAAMVSVC